MNKKILLSLFALCMFLGFTACSDEDEYTPADMPENAQVYFSNVAPSKINLSVDFSVTSFDIQLYRGDKTEALTVNLIVENESPDVFTFPTSASFAAGSDVTTIKVTYNPEKLNFDDYKSFKITISDENLTTPYGSAIYSFTAGFPAPWVNVGKAIVIESLFQSEGTVVIQNFTGTNRYRLVGIYSAIWEAQDPTDEDIPQGRDKTLEFYLDDDANAEGVPAGLQDLGMGIYGYAFYWALPGQPFSQYCKFTNEANLYRIEATRAVNGTPSYTFWLEFEWVEGYPGIIPEKFDYSAEIEYIGRLTDKSGVDHAMAEVTLGSDVAYAKVAIAPGGMTQAILTGVLNGSIESTEIEAGGNVKIPCNKSGAYTYVVVSFDAQDEAREYDYDVFDYAVGAASFSISDLFGDYILTGTGILKGYPPTAEMAVTIAAGDEPNTLFITGIDYAKRIKATFNPSNGNMSIGYQLLDNYIDEDGEYEMEFLTFANGNYSETAILTFALDENGKLEVSASSVATGYLLYGANIDDEEDQGWFDGYRNLVLTPVATKHALAKKASVPAHHKIMSKSKDLSKTTVVKQAKKSSSKKIACKIETAILSR